jgi:hypothetical protein
MPSDQEVEALRECPFCGGTVEDGTLVTSHLGKYVSHSWDSKCPMPSSFLFPSAEWNRLQAASATPLGEPVAFITERRDGSNRQIMLVEKYDPRNPEFWVNEAVRAEHRIIALYAAPLVVDEDMVERAARALSVNHWGDESEWRMHVGDARVALAALQPQGAGT